MALALARACQQQRESRRLTRAPRSPPLAQVRKEDFDNAIKSAQEALRAKTSSSQMMLEQASSAMRNAVSALSLSEQEVANLRAVVKELKEGQDGASGNEAVNRERAQLRAAQQRVQELSQNFRALQNEVARMRYEQEGVDMPVAAKFPVRIDPMLSSKVVVIAQLVMLGYSYADSEDAVDAVRVHDTELALEWLEGRNVRKGRCSREQSTIVAVQARIRRAPRRRRGRPARTNTRAKPAEAAQGADIPAGEDVPEVDPPDPRIARRSRSTRLKAPPSRTQGQLQSLGPVQGPQARGDGAQRVRREPAARALPSQPAEAPDGCDGGADAADGGCRRAPSRAARVHQGGDAGDAAGGEQQARRARCAWT